MPSGQKPGLFSCLKGVSPAKPNQNIPRPEPAAKKSGKPPAVADTLKPSLEIRALKLSCAKQRVALEARKATLAAAAQHGQAAVVRLREAQAAAGELAAALHAAKQHEQEKSQQEQLTKELLPVQLTPEPSEQPPLENFNLEALEAEVEVPQELEQKLQMLRTETMALAASIQDKQYLNKCLGLEVSTLEQSLTSLTELGDNQIIGLDTLRTKNTSLAEKHDRLAQECSLENSICLESHLEDPIYVSRQTAEGGLERNGLETLLLRAVAHHRDLSLLESRLAASRDEAAPMMPESQRLVEETLDLRPVPLELRDPSRAGCKGEVGNATCHDQLEISPLSISRIESEGQVCDERMSADSPMVGTCRRLSFVPAKDVQPRSQSPCMYRSRQADDSRQEVQNHSGVDRQPTYASLAMSAKVTQPSSQAPLMDGGGQAQEPRQMMQQPDGIDSEPGLDSLTLLGATRHSEVQRADSEPSQLRRRDELVRTDKLDTLDNQTLRDTAQQIEGTFPLCCPPRRELRDAAQQCEDLPGVDDPVTSAHGDVANTQEKEQLAVAMACNKSLRSEIEHRKTAAAATCNNALRLQIAQGKERLSQHLLREQIAQERLKQQVQNLRESLLARIHGKGSILVMSP